MQSKRRTLGKHERRKNERFRISEKSGMQSFFLRKISLGLDHNVWKFAVMLIKSYFMIVFSIVDLILFYDIGDEKKHRGKLIVGGS